MTGGLELDFLLNLIISLLLESVKATEAAKENLALHFGLHEG